MLHTNKQNTQTNTNIRTHKQTHTHTHKHIHKQTDKQTHTHTVQGWVTAWHKEGAHGSTLGWGTTLHDGRLRVRFPMRSLDLSIALTLWADPASEISTRNILRCRGQPACKSDNITAICELAVWKMWEPRRLRTLRASTACYMDSCVFTNRNTTIISTVNKAHLMVPT
jgi:hypothetical protein